ncbi:MAG: glycosyltransferase family 10 [Nitrospira sp.]|jgi:hypothetical protein|nr:glycosyltransferase family 10 [Nitrospira sp.]
MSNKATNIMLYIDPPSHHFLRDRLFELEDGRPNGDQMNAPYVHLRAQLASQGIAVRTADYLLEAPPSAGRNVYVSMGQLENYPRIVKRSDTVASAFFAMECPIVEPSLYRGLNGVQCEFKRIYSWSDSDSLAPFVGSRLRLESMCWPQSFDRVHEAVWDQPRHKFMVMINSNKLPRLYVNELYTERQKAVEYFSRTNDIELYGPGWNDPSSRVGKTWVPATVRRIQREIVRRWHRIRPDPLLEAARRVYRGRANTKAEALSQYTFALCFENMILTGWITEKIFDCFFAGTVPIYWGAPNITDRIPAECFIDMRQFSNYPDLRAFLKSLDGQAIRAYRQNARDFLSSPQFRPFSKEAFADIFRTIIREDTGVAL